MPNERQSQGEQRFCSGALHYASVLVSGSQRSAISALCLPVCHLTTSSFQTYTKTMLLLCITYPLKAGTPLGWRQSWCCRGHVGQTLPADSESSRIKLLGLLTLQTVVSEYLVAQNNSFQFTQSTGSQQQLPQDDNPTSFTTVSINHEHMHEEN